MPAGKLPGRHKFATMERRSGDPPPLSIAMHGTRHHNTGNILAAIHTSPYGCGNVAQLISDHALTLDISRGRSRVCSKAFRHCCSFLLLLS
ncbi:hypothetical protein GDO81_022272 [Engystomops pustulosus]|uniref:Uncharacterized protein n=1 Tax=Engystomops pustulosus TaxID=76066 RepID=A0AAV6YTV7_ENGPU|nr:hypothetical protein GDO81_022272 [Engystomops pustulosus]